MSIVRWQWAALAVLAALYFILALFRSAQVEMSRLRLDSVLRQAGRGSGLIDRWLSHAHRNLLLLAVQIGFQAILILFGLIAADVVEGLMPAWPAAFRLATAFLATVLLLVILMRSLLVRLLVSLFPEPAVRFSGPLSMAIALMFLPVLIPLDRLTRWLSHRFGHMETEKSEESLVEEVRAFVSLGEEEGIFEKEEVDLVRNVVDFGDTIVREIMTPRTDMVVLDYSSSLGEARQVFIETKHSRVPVQRGSADQIEGVLNIKDLLPLWCEAAERSIEHLVRPALFVPETKKVLDLLREMQDGQIPLAVVVDEYGGTAGLVTVEDVVEEIVGEIQDEHEVAEAEIVEEAGGALLVSGFADVFDVAERLQMDVKATDVDTVGGLVTSLLGRVPEAGETLEQGGVHMEVVAADGRRVLKVRMMRRRRPEPVKERNR